MTFETDFLGLMTQTCYRAPWAGQNAYGEPTYGAAVAVQCRVVHRPTLVRRAVAAGTAGTANPIHELVSTATVYTPAVGWAPQDRVTLPDGSQPVILEVRRYPDETGAHHEVVLV